MQMGLRAVVAVLLLAVPAAAEVTVTPVGERVSVRAVAAPLSDVLEQLARTTGMKVIYEGAAPRLPVTVTIEARTPVQAVLAVLEGQGLNFGLRTDAAGQRVDRLVVAGQAAASGGLAPSTPVPAHGVRGPGPAPEGRDASEGLPGFEVDGDPPVEIPPGIRPPLTRGMPPPAPPVFQTPPTPNYPNSPFAPQAPAPPQAPPPPPEPEDEKEEL